MALSASTVFEVRQSGSDASGGGYVTGSSGTDFSQQDAAQGSGTNLAVDGTTNTKVNPDGYTVAAADVGNLVQITTTGTGAAFTVGFYQITVATTGTSTTQRWTLDRSPAAINSAGATWAVGGALATPWKAFGAMVASNVAWIKSGTYASASPTVLATSNVAVRGFASARGDNPAGASRPVLQASAGSVTLVSNSANVNQRVECLVLDGNGQATVTGLNLGNTRSYVRYVTAQNCATGFGGQSDFVQCRASSCTTGFSTSGSASLATCAAVNCTTGYSLSGGTATSCYSKGGTTGFSAAAATGFLINCTAYGPSGHGFSITNSLRAINSLAVNCGLYGFNITSNAYATALVGCTGYNNTSGNANTTSAPLAFVDVVALTADPFVDGTNENFALNNNAGGGKACRAAGITGTFLGGTTTGYPDIGVAQHADAGGLLLPFGGLSGGLS